MKKRHRGNRYPAFGRQTNASICPVRLKISSKEVGFNAGPPKQMINVHNRPTMSNVKEK